MNKSLLTSCWIISFLFFFQTAWSQSDPEPTPSVFKKVELRLGVGGFWHDSKPTINYTPESTGNFSGFTSTGYKIILDIVVNENLGFSTGFKTSPGYMHSDSVDYPIFGLGFQWKQIDYTFQEWEIPLRFRYYLTKGRIQPFIDGSISINRFSKFIYSGTSYEPRYFPEGIEFESEEVTRFNGSYEIGGGVYFHLTKKLSISLDARYQLAELYWRENVNELIFKRPVLGFGIFWSLKEFQFGEN